MVMLISSREQAAQQPEATRSGAGMVPAVIRAAGSKAVESYLCFFARKSNQPSAAKGFFLWCSEYGLELTSIRAGHVATYFEHLSDKKRGATPVIYFYSVGKLFRHLEADRVIDASPFDGVSPPQKKMGLAKFKSIVRDFDNLEEGDEHFNAAMVVLYPLVIGGMDVGNISCFTRLPYSEVNLYVSRLRENGIWTSDDKISIEKESNGDEGAMIVELILQVLCATGMMERAEGLHAA